MFPILGDRAIARITDGNVTYNASTPNIGNGFVFDSANKLLIVTNYKVLTAGTAEVRNSLITVAAADADLTRIVDKGVVAEGKTIGGIASFTEPVQKYLLGDADGNGEVEILDTTTIQRKLAKMNVNVDDETLYRNGDVNFDGELTTDDVTLIQRKLAKMSVPYPIGQYVDVQ